MRTELIIQASESDAIIALLQDGRLTELVSENEQQQFSVGDVYLGVVRKLAPSLNAAFVDVGYEKDSFLHYHDLGPQIPTWQNYLKKVRQSKYTSDLSEVEILPEIEKDGAMEALIKPGDEVLVQITKEPISTKGPRVTSDISIAGRFIVLVPFNGRISVSQKIRDRKERERLRKLVQSILPKGFGVIVRTVAEGVTQEDIEADLNDLVGRWKTLYRNVRGAKPKKCILREMDRASAYLRDALDAGLSGRAVARERAARLLGLEMGQVAGGPNPNDRVTAANPVDDPLGALIAASSLAFTVVKWAGVAYLVWLGVQVWRSPPISPQVDAAEPARILIEHGALPGLAQAFAGRRGRWVPVGGGQRALGIDGPQAIEDAQHLCGRAPEIGGIAGHRPDDAFGVDEEGGAHRRAVAVLRRDHAEGAADHQCRILDDGEAHLHAKPVADQAQPREMRKQAVDRKGHEFASPLGKGFRLALCGGENLVSG